MYKQLLDKQTMPEPKQKSLEAIEQEGEQLDEKTAEKQQENITS